METLMFSQQGQQLPSMVLRSSGQNSNSSSYGSNAVDGSGSEDSSFHDPDLQYINRLLMEDDMEERKCMLRECVSYHATVKSFSDILNNDISAAAAGDGTDRLHSDVCSAPNADFRVFQQELWPTAEEKVSVNGNSSRSFEHELSNFIQLQQQRAQSYDPHDLQWMEDLLESIAGSTEEISHTQEAAEDFAPAGSIMPSHDINPEAEGSVSLQGFQASNSGTGSTLEMDIVPKTLEFRSPFGLAEGYLQAPETSDSFKSQASSNGGFKLTNYPGSHEGTAIISMSSNVNYMQNQHYNNADVFRMAQNTSHHVDNIPKMPQTASDHLNNIHIMLQTASRHANSIQMDQTASDHVDSIQGGSEEHVVQPLSSKLGNSYSSRLKRSNPETGLITLAQQGPKGSTSLSFKDDDINGASSLYDEDRVSYVQNADLRAELYAKLLNEGLASLRDKQKMKPHPSSAKPKTSKGAPKLVTTADLMNLLSSCAQAVGNGNTRRANEILREIRQDASPYGTDLQRLAHYFVEGLVARISGTGSVLYTTFTNNSPSAAKMLKARSMFVSVCPFPKVSHVFANRAIVEAAKDASRLHIVDYGISYGIQWPSLISALAERIGGPPKLRITGIDFPQPGSNPAERLEMTGQQLAEYANTYGVPFEYQAVADNWENITSTSLGLRPDEVLVVNSMYRLRHILDESVIPSDPRSTVLKNILNMNPKLFVQGIQNGSYTSPFFMSRFKEAITSYSCMFNLLEATIPDDNQERIMWEREILGRDILNVVACEGPERIERPETYKQWENRILRVGFVHKSLDEDMIKDAQHIMKTNFNKNFSMDKDGCWLLLGWKGKVVQALTKWKPGY